MNTLLATGAGLFSDSGRSSRLPWRFVASRREANPGGKLVAIRPRSPRRSYRDGELVGAVVTFVDVSERFGKPGSYWT